MIGPGTGVAPFRAFVQHRVATGARGRNWLFFGNRHFRSEFLYQVEWQEALAKKQLHRLDLAFSRDGAERVYVQHWMQEQAAELYAWVEGGAYVYVCGDASRMAPDVQSALVPIGMQQGHLSAEGAAEWLQTANARGPVCERRLLTLNSISVRSADMNIPDDADDLSGFDPN